MATLAPVFAPSALKHRLSWPLLTLTFAVVLVTLGGQLDVSWHLSIGRDSFFTPPHMMVYACGLLAAISCGFLLIASTFNPRYRDTSIQVFGLRAPTGVFLTSWGGIVMLASAPFDNWWHNAYGLDVQVASPPHIVLLAGTWAVAQGTLLLAAAQMNRDRIDHTRALGSEDPAHRRLFLFVGALCVIHLMSYSMTYTFDTRLHQAKPYLLMATGVPFALAAIASTLRRRWVCTSVAAIYTGFMLLLVWLLPLVPAHPRLGPVYQQVNHMVPPKFPILLLPAAFALDLILQSPLRKQALLALAAGTAWLVTLVAFEWPFATFLMSSHADNRFFATHMPSFGTPSTNPDVLRVFEVIQTGPALYTQLLAAALLAAIAIYLGRLFGNWMRQIQR